MLATIRWKPLVAILLAIGLIGFGVHVLRKYRFHHCVNMTLEQAIVAEKAGDYHQAIKSFRQYLAAVPDDSENWVRYALLQCKVASNSTDVERYQLLEKVLIRTPRHNLLRRKAAELGIKLGYFTQARSHLRHLRARKSNDVELLHMLAHCETSLEQYDSAQSILETIIANYPKDIDAYIHQAQLLKNRFNNPESADAIVEFMILQNPDSSSARLAAGRHYLASCKNAVALDNVTFAINVLMSDNLDLNLLAAKLSLMQNNVQESKLYLEHAYELYPEHIEPALLLADLSVQQNRPDDAVAYLTPFLKKVPVDIKTRWSMVQVLINANRYNEARLLVPDEEAPGNIARYLQARIYMRDNDWSSARSCLNSLDIDKLPTAHIKKVIQYDTARCNRALHNHKLEISAYQRALDLDPTWVPARVAYAEALMAQGDYKRARIECAQLKKLKPQLTIKLIELHLQEQMQLPLEKRNWVVIDRLISNLSNDSNSSLACKLIQAKVLVAQQQYRFAENVIATILEDYPDQIDSWLLTFQIAMANGNNALDILTEAEEVCGKRVELDIASIYYYVRFDSLNLFSILGGLDRTSIRYSVSDRIKLYSAFAHVFFLLGREDKAEKALISVANLEPNQLQVRRMLVVQTVERNDLVNARKWLSEIRAVDEKGPIATLCAALVCYGEARNGDSSAIRRGQLCLKQTILDRPKWFRPVALLGRFCELENDLSGALYHYRKAIDLGENRLFVFRRVLTLMISSQQYSSAAEILGKLPSKTVSRSEFRLFAAQVLLRSEATNISNTVLDTISNKTSGKEANYLDQLLMAQIARRGGRFEKAERLFRRAISLNRQDPTGWIALVRFLAAQDPKKAQVELKKASEIVELKNRNLVIGFGFEALGRNGEAEQVFSKLLQDHSNDIAIVQTVAAFYLRQHRLAQAEIVLRRLLLFKNVHDVSWARKWLAVTLAFRGGRKRFEEAKKLIENIENMGKSNTDATLYKALVLASRPDCRKESLRLFESMKLELSELAPTMRLLVAQLYEAEGDWGHAREKYLSLLDERHSNPMYISKFIEASLRHDRANECIAWVDRLKKLSPNSRASLSLEIRTLIAIGEPKKALEAIAVHLSNPNPQLDLAGLMLELLNHHDEAEAALRKFVMSSKNPEDVLLLARFIGRRGRISEALKICDSSQQKCAPMALCSAYLSIVRHPLTAAGQLERVEQHIRECCKQDPNQIIFLVFLADVLEMQGRTNAAIHCYRTVLNRDHGNIVALNNLAYLYAHQPSEISNGLKLINKAIDYAGPLPSLRDTRAVLLMQSNKMDKAETDLQIAIRKGPGPLKYFHLAQIHIYKKNYHKARRAIAKARDYGLSLDKFPRSERRKYLQVIGKLK